MVCSWEVDMIAKLATTHSIGLGHRVVLLIFPRLGNNSDGIHVVGDMDYWNSGGGCDVREVVCDP